MEGNPHDTHCNVCERVTYLRVSKVTVKSLSTLIWCLHDPTVDVCRLRVHDRQTGGRHPNSSLTTRVGTGSDLSTGTAPTPRRHKLEEQRHEHTVRVGKPPTPDGTR